MEIKIVFTDLDGTLLNDKREISKANWAAFKQLSALKITTVAATGRSVEMVKKVVPSDFPFDYIIFSSGAGVMDWKTREVLFERQLSAEQVNDIVEVLNSNKIDFMLQGPIPHNHHFIYRLHGKPHPDFEYRIFKGKGFCNPVTQGEKYDQASQFLIILDSVDDFERVSGLFKDVNIIRATSPINGRSIWMEIFHEEVSKGKAAEWLCSFLNIPQSCTFAVGNDYNDLDLLDFASVSYLTQNSPEEIRNGYKVTRTNVLDGVAVVLSNEVLPVL